MKPSVGDMKLMQFGQRVLEDTKEVANCLDDRGSQAGSKKRSPWDIIAMLCTTSGRKQVQKLCFEKTA